MGSGGGVGPNHRIRDAKCLSCLETVHKEINVAHKTVRILGVRRYRDGNTESNRRRAVGKDVIAALWEIHPVMNVTVVHQ